MDIGQGAGLATTSGVRPLLPPIVAGAMAKADAGIDFSGTDFSWMESWWWIGGLAALFIAGWLLDRSRTNDRAGEGRKPPAGRRPETSAGYGALCAAMGALTFAASLAAGHDAEWPGFIGGALLGFIGYLALARLFMRATARLAVAGDAGVLLGLARDAIGITASVVIILLDVVGYVAVVVALLLLLGARGRSEEKYEGLRVLR